MPLYAYLILAAGWAFWLTPFFLKKPGNRTAEKRDLRARWGVIMQAISYSVIWWSPFWNMPFEFWRVPASIIFFIIGGLFVWSSIRTLGRQWRIDAGLNADHELIRNGPYRLVRHPIYTSMLCLLLGTGFLVSPLWLLGIATLCMLIGTQIRVSVEEGLLKSHFGEEFHKYQRDVPAYMPFLKFRRASSAAPE